MEIDGKSVVVDVTPVVSLTPYSDGDQLGAPMKLAAMFDTSGDTSAIQTWSILDKAKQKSAIDVLFFNALPVVASSDNAPLNISSAEMAQKFVGRISLLAADFSDLSANSVATINNAGLLVKSAGNTSIDLYCVFQIHGTPTYASTSDLVMKIGAFQD